MKYQVVVPPTAQQGSYKTIVSDSYGQTFRGAALQDYNSCRAHDGLPPVSRMPIGTIYRRIHEQVAAAFENGARIGVISDGRLIEL